MFFYALSYLFFFYAHVSPVTSVTPNNIFQDCNNLLCVCVLLCECYMLSGPNPNKHPCWRYTHTVWWEGWFNHLCNQMQCVSYSLLSIFKQSFPCEHSLTEPNSITQAKKLTRVMLCITYAVIWLEMYWDKNPFEKRTMFSFIIMWLQILCHIDNNQFMLCDIHLL